MVPSDPGPDLLQDGPPFGALQFTVDEIQSVLLELDVSKGAGLDDIPHLILQNCASAFVLALSLLYLTETWKLSYLTPIFKKGRHNNIEDYRGVAILSAISKRFELGL
jgi:hypothetical protein